MRNLLFKFACLLAITTASPIWSQENLITIDEADAKFQGLHGRMWMGNFSYDDTVLVTSSGWDTTPGELILWNLETKKPAIVRRQNAGIRTAVFSPDGETLAMSDFHENLLLIDQTTGVAKALPKQKSTANSILFTSDSKQVLCGCSNGDINQVNLETGMSTKVLNAPGERVVTIALSTNGEKLVAVTWTGRAYVWDFPQRTLLHTLDVVQPQYAGRVPAEALAFAPEEMVFVTGTFEGTVRTWNASSGEMLQELKKGGEGQLTAAYSPDGNLLVTAGNQGHLSYWDPATGQLLHSLQAHPEQCTSVAFTHSGDRLLTTSWDGSAKVWDRETRELITTLSPNSP